MITTPEDYLKYLHQIQNTNPPTGAILLPTDEKIYNIDLNNRVIEAPEFLSVEKDHRSETIYFKFDRYFDNTDLTNTICLIQYINKNSKDEFGNYSSGYIYPVPFYDVTHFKSENKVLIPWMIEGPATAAAGPVDFSILFYLVDDAETSPQFIYKLNTLVATSKVLHGLDVMVNNENFIVSADVSQLLLQEINQLKTAFTSGISWVVLD